MADAAFQGQGLRVGREKSLTKTMRMTTAVAITITTGIMTVMIKLATQGVVFDSKDGGILMIFWLRSVWRI